MAEAFFADNREKLFKYLEDGQVAVFFSGVAPKKLGDENYPFTPERNFYYLTGIAREHCILFMGKNDNIKNVILYIKRDNGILAKWVGANLTSNEANEISGISDIRFVDEFKEDLAAYFFKNQSNALYLDLENRSFSSTLTFSQSLAENFRKRFAYIKILDIFNIMGNFRLYKEEFELNLMRKAIDITCDAFRAMMLNAKPDMFEYEIEAYFDYVLKKNGVMDRAFSTIAAAGTNGTILHYSKNNQKANDGDLILVDAGAQVGYYNGDITRTFPVNGKFSDRQKLVYNIVLSGQKKVIDAIYPGALFDDLNKILKTHYLEQLGEIGLAHDIADVEKYYYHSVSHYLGAETHDVGRYSKKELAPGMVITVEPGLYIEQWGIGVRIEDDVLVTETGNEVLSKGLIKTVDEIESFMSGKSNG